MGVCVYIYIYIAANIGFVDVSEIRSHHHFVVGKRITVYDPGF
jgi:hypothetical protein